jgi:hypothetical protein
MLDCADFLDGYTDYRDGRLDDGTLASFRQHLTECASCARYDRVVQRGTRLFCELPELTPSDDFQARLQHRIYHLEDERRRFGASASGVPTGYVLSIAALLMIAAWAPLARPRPARSAVTRLPAVAAHAPHPGDEWTRVTGSAQPARPAAPLFWATDPARGMAVPMLLLDRSPAAAATARQVDFHVAR